MQVNYQHSKKYSLLDPGPWVAGLTNQIGIINYYTGCLPSLYIST